MNFYEAWQKMLEGKVIKPTGVEDYHPMWVEQQMVKGTIRIEGKRESCWMWSYKFRSRDGDNARCVTLSSDELASLMVTQWEIVE